MIYRVSKQILAKNSILCSFFYNVCHWNLRKILLHSKMDCRPPLFFYSIFLRANCEYHETKKRFFLKLIWTPEFCTKRVSMCSTLTAEERWNPTREHHEFQQETFKLLHHWMTLMSRQIGQLSWLGFKYKKKSLDLQRVLKLNDILFTVHMTT